MANREKKEASDAIRNLSSFLRNDSRYVGMLQNISKYIASLRKGKAEAVSRQDSLSAKLTEYQTSLHNAESTISLLQHDLDLLQSKYRQLNCSYQSMVKKNCKLAEHIENLHYDPEESKLAVPVDYDQVVKAAKVLRRRLPNPPMARRIWADHMLIIDLDDIVHKFTEDEFITLGMFVAVFAKMFVPIGVTDIQGKVKWQSKEQLEKLKPFARWIHKYYETNPIEAEYYDKTCRR